MGVIAIIIQTASSADDVCVELRDKICAYFIMGSNEKSLCIIDF